MTMLKIRVKQISLNSNWTAEGSASYNIKNIADPVDPQDAATKYYVDDAIAGALASSPIILSNQTTNAADTELFVDGTPGNRILVPTNTSIGFSITVIGIKSVGATVGDTWMHRYTGLITRTGSVTRLVGGFFTEETIAEDPGAALWTAEVDADDVNDAIVVKVTGEVAKTIEWVAKVELTQVSY